MYFQAAFQPQSSQEHESLALRRTDRGWKLVVELEARGGGRRRLQVRGPAGLVAAEPTALSRSKHTHS